MLERSCFSCTRGILPGVERVDLRCPSSKRGMGSPWPSQSSSRWTTTSRCGRASSRLSTSVLRQAGRHRDRDPQPVEQGHWTGARSVRQETGRTPARRITSAWSVRSDLSRTGNHGFMVPFESNPRRASRTTYAACVRRGWKPLQFEYYRLPLRERLPAFRIPLRQNDDDVPLDLQAVIDQCYESALYDDIDYREDPDPPLRGDDAQWADALLREQGRR